MPDFEPNKPAPMDSNDNILWVCTLRIPETAGSEQCTGSFGLHVQPGGAQECGTQAKQPPQMHTA